MSPPVLPIVGWLVMGLLALALIAVVGFFVVFLLAAMYETHHLRRLDYVPPGEARQLPKGKAGQHYDAALGVGCLAIGAFRDRESELTKVTVWLMVSEDGEIVVMITSWARALGYHIISRLDDGVWLYSSPVGNKADLSGLVAQASLPNKPFEAVYFFHRNRVVSADAPVVAFDPETLVDDLLEHERRRAELTIARGWGRWLDPDHTRWRYTPRGALRLMMKLVLGGSTPHPRNDTVENLTPL
ncbi:MAG: hypothetical protein AAGI68_02500 [Planctomycetota bacterium]